MPYASHLPRFQINGMMFGLRLGYAISIMLTIVIIKQKERDIYDRKKSHSRRLISFRADVPSVLVI